MVSAVFRTTRRARRCVWAALVPPSVLSHGRNLHVRVL